jgi:hypothetical protein
MITLQVSGVICQILMLFFSIIFVYSPYVTCMEICIIFVNFHRCLSFFEHCHNMAEFVIIKIKTVMIGALPRYATGGCCQNVEHVPNRHQRGFLDEVVAEEVHKCIRDFLFVESMRHVSVMNPWVGL